LRSRTNFQRYRGPSSIHVLHSRTHFRRYRFHVLRSSTRFRWNRERRVPFTCFALLNSFRLFREHRVLFSYFAFPDSFSTVPRSLGPVFMFCAPELVFSGTEGVRSFFHVLRSRTRFQWYRGRQVPFSCFALLDSFSTIPRASGPVFIFCTRGLIFDGTMGLVFMFCGPRPIFGGTEGVMSRFHMLHSSTHFQRY
jgi:hypothetical protein